MSSSYRYVKENMTSNIMFDGDKSQTPNPDWKVLLRFELLITY